jgi:hypothetical protein
MDPKQQFFVYYFILYFDRPYSMIFVLHMDLIRKLLKNFVDYLLMLLRIHMFLFLLVADFARRNRQNRCLQHIYMTEHFSWLGTCTPIKSGGGIIIIIIINILLKKIFFDIIVIITVQILRERILNTA